MTSRDSAGGAASDGFQRELGQFLLVAFAAGDDVEGEWHLMDTDPLVPGVYVTVTRVDAGPPFPVSAKEVTITPGEPGSFKTRLQSFLLERFADGEAIEGTWAVRTARDPLPEWEVDIATDADFDVDDRGICSTERR